MRRLASAGFRKDFVQPAILPDWWDDSCGDDPAALTEVEIRVARFLGMPLSVVGDPSTDLASPGYPDAQLRRVRDIDRDRLAPAIHSAIQIAAAVVRSMRDPGRKLTLPPENGVDWRSQIVRPHPAVVLADVLDDLWLRGIPVVPLDVLPAPSFQGLACTVEGRPVVLLGHKHDEPGRVAFLVAHEAGHIAAGDCAADQPVVDADEMIADDTDLERRADRFATRVLVGADTIPEVQVRSHKELATKALQLERSIGADATTIILGWARRTADYANATMAVKALYRGSGARRQLRQCFDHHVDVDGATESDRALLRCVYGDPDRDATAA